MNINIRDVFTLLVVTFTLCLVEVCHVHYVDAYDLSTEPICIAIRGEFVQVRNAKYYAMDLSYCFTMTSHALTRVGLDCRNRSRSGLCSKLPDMPLVGDIALIRRFAKVNVCSFSMYTFI